MQSNNERNPPMFPTVVDKRHHQELDTIMGMTLRDHFAGLAMQSILTYSKASPGEMAKSAYQMADNMLIQRIK